MQGLRSRIDILSFIQFLSPPAIGTKSKAKTPVPVAFVPLFNAESFCGGWNRVGSCLLRREVSILDQIAST